MGLLFYLKALFFDNSILVYNTFWSYPSLCLFLSSNNPPPSPYQVSNPLSCLFIFLFVFALWPTKLNQGYLCGLGCEYVHCKNNSPVATSVKTTTSSLPAFLSWPLVLCVSPSGEPWAPSPSLAKYLPSQPCAVLVLATVTSAWMPAFVTSWPQDNVSRPSFLLFSSYMLTSTRGNFRSRRESRERGGRRVGGYAQCSIHAWIGISQ